MGTVRAWLPCLCRACADNCALVQAQDMGRPLWQVDLRNGDALLNTVPRAAPTLWQRLKNIINACIQICSPCPFLHTAKEVI